MRTSLLALLALLPSCVDVGDDVDDPTLATESAAITHADPLTGAPSAFKLLIVAPQSFVDSLQPLVDWKNATGMRTFVVTMEDVRALSYPTYDDAYKLKQVIVRAHEQFGAQYVMLAGDQSVIPARERTDIAPDTSYNPDERLIAEYVPTDHYYANLYDNHDPSNPAIHGGFAMWNGGSGLAYDEAVGPDALGDPPSALDVYNHNPGHVDGYPDVAVGRVPAESADEISRYGAKVIAYEKGQKTAPNPTAYTWIADGGYDHGVDEASPLVLQIRHRAGLDDTPAQKLMGVGYNAPGNAPLPAGFDNNNWGGAAVEWYQARWITYVGHGWTGGWDGWNATDLDALTNTGNLPIVFAAACNSGAFGPMAPGNHEEYLGVDGKTHRYDWNDDHRWAYDSDQGLFQSYPWSVAVPSIYQPESSAVRGMATSALFQQNGGGAIAYFGDVVVTQDGKPAWLAGYLMQAYAGGAQTLGDAYLAGQRGYWNDTRLSHDFFQAARVYLSEMELSGDPSLRLRGVPAAPTPHVEPPWAAHNSMGGYVTQLGAALDHGGAVEAIVAGGEQRLWQRQEPWSYDWQKLWVTGDAYTITAPPTIVREAADDSGDRPLHVFALMNTGVMADWLELGTAPNASYTPRMSTTNPSGLHFASSPGAGQRADGGVELFATATDGSVWIDYQTATTSGVKLADRHWSGWATFGTPPSGARGQPAVGVNAGGGLEVYVRGNDGHDYGRFKPTQYGAWSGWFGLGGNTLYDPVVARNADGRLEIFAVDAGNHNLCHIWQQAYPQPPWSNWACDFGGYVTAKPAVAADADGSLNLFVRGGEGNLWHLYQTFDARIWSGWENLGGNLDGGVGITATRDGVGRVEVYYRRASDGVLMGVSQLRQ